MVVVLMRAKYYVVYHSQNSNFVYLYRFTLLCHNSENESSLGKSSDSFYVPLPPVGLLEKVTDSGVVAIFLHTHA